ncbi:MAG: DNA endonuclease SmrA [Gammaproteobacteria bacterium]
MTEQENDLFAREMAGVVPLKADARVLLEKDGAADAPGRQYRRMSAGYSREERNGALSLVLKRSLGPDDWLSYKANGIQTGVFKNLRLGKYPLEATLSLACLPPERARMELLDFVAECIECDVRSVLIRFGGKQQGTCLIKSYIAQWLPELDDVQAFHTAQRHHGGNRAVYVLFRKSERKRQENRERHAARQG